MNRHQSLVVNNSDPEADMSPKCRLCGEGDETPIHLIHECPPFHEDSLHFFGEQEGDPKNDNFELRWTGFKLTSFMQLVRVQRLLNNEGDDPEVEEELNQGN